MAGGTLQRRCFLAGGLSAALGALHPPSKARQATQVKSSAHWRGLDWSLISAMTDEVGTTEEEAFSFVRRYGLKWIELRTVPGGGRLYVECPIQRLQEFRRQIDDLGLGVSFLKTWMLKWTLPGTSPLRSWRYSEPEWNERYLKDVERLQKRLEYLRRCIEAAHILNVDSIRIFTFWRVEDPAKHYPAIAEVINKMAELAHREGMRLLIENESAWNVATSRELVQLLELLPSPSIGINWDPHNGLPYEPSPFPEGYGLLPRGRIGNVQIKGESLLTPGEIFDWRLIMTTLLSVGYQGRFGLETHFGRGPERVRNAHASMKEIGKLLDD